MKIQNYSNHSRYYIPHHLVFYPITFICGLAFSYFIFNNNNAMIWGGMVTLLILIVSLAFMLRQHYALTIQNRVVRLELRLRYYIITQKRFENIESKLSESQIFALRFASDEELENLIEKTINENMNPDAIKKSIKKWIPDNQRV